MIPSTRDLSTNHSTHKALDQRVVTCGLNDNRHLSTLLIKYHICYGVRASSTRDPFPERGFPTRFMKMESPS